MVNTALATVLIIYLSTGGHWLAHQAGTIHIAWVSPAHATPAVLSWQLLLRDMVLAEGTLKMLDPTTNTRSLTVQAPEVRVRTAMQWRYTLRAEANGQILDQGVRTLHLYPESPLRDAVRYISEPVAVLAPPKSPLPLALEEAGIPFRQVNHVSSLQLSPPTVLLVAANQWMPSPTEEGLLLELAQAGTSVLILEHRRISQLLGFQLRHRPRPDRWIWQTQHPLLRGFEAADLATWTATTEDVWALEIPDRQPALAVVAWPREEAAVTSALILTHPLGAGRVVLCQIPLGPWQSDPRSQQLLANALDYLQTRPAPSAARAERSTKTTPPDTVP